jgi:hypothetical protein
VFLALLAWVVAAVAHEGWSPPSVSVRPVTRPVAVVWATAAIGHESAAASMLWIRAVVEFVNAEEPDAAWLREAIATAATLDPAWRAPSRYGALMLADLGDIDGHEAVLEQAAARWPDDPWFPAALGMSRWLREGDAAGAARWLGFAAATPGADPLLGRLAERAREREP